MHRARAGVRQYTAEIRVSDFPKGRIARTPAAEYRVALCTAKTCIRVNDTFFVQTGDETDRR